MTNVLKSFSVLQSELDVAKSTLKGVDENIKRLIGRDPFDISGRPTGKRNIAGQTEERGRVRNIISKNDNDRRSKNFRVRTFNTQDGDEPPIKKRFPQSDVSVFKRLSERPPASDEANLKLNNKGMISKVIVTPKEVPSRQERLEAQSKDTTSIARNKRMFGALLGTLQKFQQEETRLKQKEEKRAQLEKKIEEHEIKEKEEIKKERQELFYNRKRKQAEIKMIELKMLRMREHARWEENQKSRMNFIQTKTKPHIHYLPRRLNEATKTLLEESKNEIQSLIDTKRTQVQEELEQIEERAKRPFEPRNKVQQELQKEQENEENELDDEDITMEELQEESQKVENAQITFEGNDYDQKENNETTEDDQKLNGNQEPANTVEKSDENNCTPAEIVEDVNLTPDDEAQKND